MSNPMEEIQNLFVQSIREGILKMSDTEREVELRKFKTDAEANPMLKKHIYENFGDLIATLDQPVSGRKFQIGDLVKCSFLNGEHTLTQSSCDSDMVAIETENSEFDFYDDGLYESDQELPSLTLVAPAAPTAKTVMTKTRVHGHVFFDDGKLVTSKLKTNPDSNYADMEKLKALPGICHLQAFTFEVEHNSNLSL